MGDVRCPGLFTAVELVTDKTTKEPARKESEQVYELGLKHGVMFGTSRYAGLGNVVKIKPPLTVTREELDRVIDVFDQVLMEIEGSSR
jgi:4-aminobutyrate aminotransferase-like enzyme